MLGNNQGSPYDQQPKVFKGVRFVLLGFDPIPKSQVLNELVDGGGVDVGKYGPSCTHVIVDKIAYDDPICVAARNDGKIVVSGLWVNHSSDVGMLVDYSSVMYRPLKDLNGIPGAKSLIVCLTGYQRQDRDDIMTMVGLMGATFSKPLVAHKVTHLICYKFEGEKYELAKRFKRMKIVNHRWLEDCLKAWEIVPEENYNISGYELETLEAEAKDSEDEADDYATKNHVEKTAGTQQPLALKQEVSGSPLNSYASKSFGTSINMISAAGRNSPNQAPISHIATGEPSNPYNRVEIPAAAGNNSVSTSEGEKKSPHFDAEKFSTLSYSRKTPGRTPTSNYSRETASGLNSASKLGKLNLDEGAKKSPHSDAEKFSTLIYSRKTPGITPTSNCSGENAGDLNSASKLGKLNLVEHFDITSSTTAQVTDGAVLADVRTPSKGSVLRSEEDKHGSSGKRKMDAVCGSLKLLKTSHNTEEHVLENPMVASGAKGLENIIMKGPPVETTNRPSPGNSSSPFNEMAALNAVKGSLSNIAAKISSTSNRKLVTCHTTVSSNNASEDMGGKNLEANQMSLKSTKTDTLKTEPEIHKFGKGKQEHAIHDIQSLHNEVQEAEIASPGIERSHVEKSNSSLNVDITRASSESSSKLLRKKSVGKKLLGVKQKLGKENSANQKGSMYLKKSAPSSKADHITFDSHEFLHCENFEKATLAGNAIKEIDMEKNGITHSDNLAGNKSLSVDDETEPPEDKEEDTIRENPKEVEQDKAVIKNNTEEGLPQMDQDDDKVEGRTKCENLVCGDKVQVEKHTNVETSINQAKTKGRKRPLGKLKKNIAVSDQENVVNTMTGEKSETNLLKADQTVDNDIIRNAQESSACGDNPVGNSVIVENLAKENVARGKKCPSRKSKKGSVLTVAELAEKKTLNGEGLASEKENEKLEIEESHPAGKTKKRAIMSVLENSKEAEKENVQIHAGDQNTSPDNMQMKRSASKCRKSQPKTVDSVSAPIQEKVVPKTEPMWFMLSGHRLQRKEFQKVIRGLKGKVCRDSHQWSYQATHLVVPDPLKRTEKFFAAAASGRWILKTDYLSASHQAGRLLEEEPYEWHKKGLTEDGAINLEAPRKWRLLKEKTGHGAFYGMKIIVYGECIAPPLDTLKRVVKAGDGTILATSPPYTRFLGSGVDFAVVSPGMPRVDMWVQEFLRNEIPCVVADYLVEYVCKTGYPLDRHVQYGTHSWTEKSLEKLKDQLQEIVEPSTPEHCKFTDTPCEACGSRDRGDVMLICGDETGSTGCGAGMHIDCCDPPLADVPEEDWFCPKCSKKENSKGSQQKGTKRKKASSSKRR